MFRSTPYSSIPDRYIPYVPEEIYLPGKFEKNQKPVFPLQ